MDRRDIFAFIVIYTFAVCATFFFGGSNEIDVTPGDVQAATHSVQGDSSEAIATTLRQFGDDVSDVVQLPMIIVTPDAGEQEVVKDQ